MALAASPDIDGRARGAFDLAALPASMKRTPRYEHDRDPRNPPSDAKQRQLDHAVAKQEGAGGSEDKRVGSDENNDLAT